MFSAYRARHTIFATLAALAGATAGCARDATHSAAGRVLAVDDFGDTVRLTARPTRIVSLNPSTTEILFALGAGDRLVGRSHYDVYPDAATRVPDLGSAIRPNVETLLAARPQLAVLYATADNRAAASALRAAGIAVIALKNDRIEQFAPTVRLLAVAIGDSARGAIVVDTVMRTLARVRAATSGAARPRVVWPLFDQPLFVIGGGSFLSELVDIAGGTNVFADARQPSPPMSREEVLRRDADVVLASSDSLARHVLADPAWRGLTAVRAHRVYGVDRALVERPAVRLGEAALAIARLLHPELASRLR